MNRRSGKNPARKRIGRLMPQLRAAPDLHASRPKPHLATGQRQGHPDEVGPLEARGPTSSKLRATSSKLRAAEKKTPSRRKFFPSRRVFFPSRGKFSPSRGVWANRFLPFIGAPQSTFFAGTLSHTPAQRLQAVGRRGLLLGKTSTPATNPYTSA